MRLTRWYAAVCRHKVSGPEEFRVRVGVAIV